MGFFSRLFSQPNPPELPKVNTILPDAATKEIKSGRLPQLKTDTIFTQNGELIHYIDKAILLKDKTKKHYKGKRMGYSMPGLFKGDRINFGGGTAEPVEEIVTEQFKGILYITNRRVIFVNKDNGFDKPYKNLSAVTPYTNGIELQYGSTTYSLLVPDGDIPNLVIKLVH
ncbi:MAG: hypothetical protein PHV32_01240 [Eubacteriales bacterium]|nr:hypothetical protein [Eubacteriales bacterium]